ncbi:hypothetical protein G4Z16_01415 [Streptomyces bathyalis]|uniref:Uncharacterized protein n=1 Tax=Streptomyces bathyalis TaxID=2710756 RepID=A0A7T1T2M3_9ACTN|nr:hypothetical protein [Streptomyces bathyalis]QPP05263.1 hypothetical protein G4Z16_01415 [Streptomyces bathyalis]
MRRSRAERPEAEWDRERAWAHLLENPDGIRYRSRQDLDGTPQLSEIARRYDSLRARASGFRQPDATETDILASLLVIRELREKLEADELQFMKLAREKRITWSRIATASEMSGRQSAERRYLQLSRAYTHPDGRLPHTQSERVEQARDLRSRRAERRWALQHARTIRRIADQLAAIPNLQQRVGRSDEARIISTIHKDGEARKGRKTTETVQLRWPTALKECLREDAPFRTDVSKTEEVASHRSNRREQEADIVHRLLGLITYANYPRNIDLGDLPDLAEAIADLCHTAEAQRWGR